MPLIQKFAVTIGIFFGFSCWTQAQRILVVDSYHPEYQWGKSYKLGLEKKLRGKAQLEYFSLDSKRLFGAKLNERVNLALEKLGGEAFDLIVLADDFALKSLGLASIGKGVPVVTLGINNNPRNYGISGARNFTGLLERPLLKRSIAMISQIVPAKRVLVMLDDGTTSKIIAKKVFLGKRRIEVAGVTVDVRTIGRWTQWKKQIKNAKGQYDAIFIGLYDTIKDDQKRPVDSHRVIHWTSVHSGVPLFAFWAHSVGIDKTAGGFVLFGEDQGLEAGEIILKVLKGAVPNSIPVSRGKTGRYYFSETMLKRWNIVLPGNIRSKAQFVD